MTCGALALLKGILPIGGGGCLGILLPIGGGGRLNSDAVMDDEVFAGEVVEGVVRSEFHESNSSSLSFSRFFTAFINSIIATFKPFDFLLVLLTSYHQGQKLFLQISVVFFQFK